MLSTWLVTINHTVATGRAMLEHRHTALESYLRGHGRLTIAGDTIAEFDIEDRARDFAERLAGTFPEDEVGLWHLDSRADRQRGPATRTPGSFRRTT